MARWVRVCDVDEVDNEDVIPVTIDGHHYAIYRSPDDTYYATDGQCTHEKVLLADGLVMGHVIECPKHNGRYDYRTGTGLCAPIVESLRTYPARVDGGSVEIDVDANMPAVTTDMKGIS